MLEVIGALGVIVLAAVVLVVVLTNRGGPRDAPALPEAGVSDRHRHRWTRWRIVDERQIHTYGEVDEGRDLPDRIDVVVRRECARCGLPQTQTVRGLDQKRSD